MTGKSGEGRPVLNTNLGRNVSFTIMRGHLLQLPRLTKEYCSGTFSINQRGNWDRGLGWGKTSFTTKSLRCSRKHQSFPQWLFSPDWPRRPGRLTPSEPDDSLRSTLTNANKPIWEACRTKYEYNYLESEIRIILVKYSCTVSWSVHCTSWDRKRMEV